MRSRVADLDVRRVLSKNLCYSGAPNVQIERACQHWIQRRDRTEQLGATTHHSKRDFESAMLRLSAADRVRLKRVGLRYSGGTGMSPDELLSEAYVRAAAAKGRNWSTQVDVVRFMAEAMRSIASGARASVKADARSLPAALRSNQMADAEAVTDRAGVVIAFTCPSPSPEQELIEGQEAAEDALRLSKWRQELLDLFVDDYQAQLIVEGMMDGLRGRALQELVGLTGVEFATKYKKVSRRIEALTAERRQA